MKTWKHRAKSPRAFAVIVVFGFIFTGCNDGNGNSNPIAVKSVTLNKEELELKVEETETLKATVLPSKAADKTVTWHSNNTTVATVADGVVTAKAKGQATITVTTKNGKKANCVVTVNLAPDSRAVTGVTVAPTELELRVGHTEPLTATVLPENATNQKVTWSTGDATKVTVADGSDPNIPAGTVKGVAETTEHVTITVTTEDGNKTATCEVTVKPRNPDEIAVTGVTLSEDRLDLVTDE
jgi:uncharacterized protein YjdB